MKKLGVMVMAKRIDGRRRVVVKSCTPGSEAELGGIQGLQVIASVNGATDVAAIIEELKGKERPLRLTIEGDPAAPAANASSLPLQSETEPETVAVMEAPPPPPPPPPAASEGEAAAVVVADAPPPPAASEDEAAGGVVTEALLPAPTASEDQLAAAAMPETLRPPPPLPAASGDESAAAATTEELPPPLVLEGTARAVNDASPPSKGTGKGKKRPKSSKLKKKPRAPPDEEVALVGKKVPQSSKKKKKGKSGIAALAAGLNLDPSRNGKERPEREATSEMLQQLDNTASTMRAAQSKKKAPTRKKKFAFAADEKDIVPAELVVGTSDAPPPHPLHTDAEEPSAPGVAKDALSSPLPPPLLPAGGEEPLTSTANEEVLPPPPPLPGGLTVPVEKTAARKSKADKLASTAVRTGKKSVAKTMRPKSGNGSSEVKRKEKVKKKGKMAVTKAKVCVAMKERVPAPAESDGGQKRSAFVEHVSVADGSVDELDISGDDGAATPEPVVRPNEQSKPIPKSAPKSASKPKHKAKPVLKPAPAPKPTSKHKSKSKSKPKLKPKPESKPKPEPKPKPGLQHLFVEETSEGDDIVISSEEDAPVVQVKPKLVTKKKGGSKLKLKSKSKSKAKEGVTLTSTPAPAPAAAPAQTYAQTPASVRAHASADTAAAVNAPGFLPPAGNHQTMSAADAVNIIAAMSGMASTLLTGAPPHATAQRSASTGRQPFVSGSPSVGSAHRSPPPHTSIGALKKRLWRWYAFMDEAIDDGASNAELEPIKRQIARTEDMLASVQQPERDMSLIAPRQGGWSAALLTRSPLGGESPFTRTTASPIRSPRTASPRFRPASPGTPPGVRVSSPGPVLPPGLPNTRVEPIRKVAEARSVESALDAMRLALDACSEIHEIIENAPFDDGRGYY